MEMLCAGSVNDINALVASFQFPTEALFLGEHLPQHVIEPKDRQDLLRFTYIDVTVDFARYTSGRIFHPDFELRWAKLDHKKKRKDEISTSYQAVYLGVERSVPLLKVVREVRMDEYEPMPPKHYYLFGERVKSDLDMNNSVHADGGIFAEARIPRLLYYPALPEAERVQLVVREYVHKKTGSVSLFRFMSLEAVEAEG